MSDNMMFFVTFISCCAWSIFNLIRPKNIRKPITKSDILAFAPFSIPLSLFLMRWFL